MGEGGGVCARGATVLPPTTGRISDYFELFVEV